MAQSAEKGFKPRTKLNYEELRARLRSEYGPAIRSETEIARALGDVDKDLDDCDAEIFRVQSHIIVLQNERERLEEYKSCLRSLASPIRRIPSEILVRIFNYTCDTNAVFSHDLRDMPALALGGVCSRWLALTRSHSALWSNIDIKWRETDARGLLILKLYLACSERSSLAIRLVGNSTDANLPALDVLNEHSHRWQRLYIDRVNAGLLLFRNHPTKFFPLLEAYEAPLLKLVQSATILCNAPRLRRLAVFSVPSLQNFPWAQLTSIDFSNAPANENLAPILKACHALKEMRIHENSSQVFQRCKPAIMIPALDILSLDLCQTSHSESLAEEAFASITSPSLTSLLIHGTRLSLVPYARAWPKESVHSFLTRSSCRITALSMKRIPLSDIDLTDLLHMLPSLLDLIIDDTDVAPSRSPLTPRFVKSLHAFRGTGILSALVPELQNLSLTASASSALEIFDGFTDRDFVDMVSSRWLPNPQYAAQVGVACLRSVVLRLGNRSIDEEVYRPLRYIEKAGMRVVVTGCSAR